MRSFSLGTLALGVFSASLAVGCGDSGGTTGSGGGGTGGGTTTTNSGGSTNGTGGSAGCTAITVPDFAALGTDSSGYPNYGGSVMPALGGAGDDSLLLIISPTATGSVDLAPQMDALVIVFEDDDGMGGAAKYYLADSGTAELGTTTPYYITGTLSNVHLSEVDDMGAPLPGGACLTAASIPFDIQPPVAGWTCDPTWYGDMLGCDCACGAVDPDCADAAMTLYNCQEGQTCDANAGVPTGWTLCAADQFNGGAANGCDCACGAWDPDCDLMPTPTVDGCTAGDTCSGSVGSGTSVCVPAAWTWAGRYQTTPAWTWGVHIG